MRKKTEEWNTQATFASPGCQDTSTARVNRSKTRRGKGHKRYSQTFKVPGDHAEFVVVRNKPKNKLVIPNSHEHAPKCKPVRPPLGVRPERLHSHPEQRGLPAIDTCHPALGAEPLPLRELRFPKPDASSMIRSRAPIAAQKIAFHPAESALIEVRVLRAFVSGFGGFRGLARFGNRDWGSEGGLGSSGFTD